VVGQQNADICDTLRLRDVAMATTFWLSLGYNFRCMILGVGFPSQDIRWRHSRDRVSKGRCHGNHFLPFLLSVYGVHIGAAWRIRLNRPRAAAMQPYVKLLSPLVITTSDHGPWTPPVFTGGQKLPCTRPCTRAAMFAVAQYTLPVFSVRESGPWSRIVRTEPNTATMRNHFTNNHQLDIQWAQACTRSHFAFALCCHSNATRVRIANPPNRAQLGGSPTTTPSYFRVRAIV